MEKTIPAAELRRLGRYENAGDPLGFSMSGISMRAACTRLDVEISCAYGSHSPWMGVLVDGAPVGRFSLKQGTHWYQAVGGMDAQFSHQIAIVRDSQPVPEDASSQFIIIERVCVDGEVQPAEKPSMIIEFAGDSLTSGEGTVGPVSALEWRMAYMSAMNTYAQLVCCQLGAEGRWISQSGWGIHAAWDGDETRCIPLIYDQVCATDEAGKKPYDFAREPADWIVINLGTNDGAPLNRLPRGAQRSEYRQKVHAAAKAFLQTIRRLNPEAHVLWAYGMCGRLLEKEIQGAVEWMQQTGDEQMHYLRVPACRADEIGSRQHPGPASHRRVALAIAAFINKATKK